MYNEIKIFFDFQNHGVPMTNRFAEQIDLSGCSIKQELVDNEMFYRYKLDGNLIFWGADYNDLLTFIGFNVGQFVLVHVYQNNTKLFETYIDIKNVSINYDSKLITCKTGETNDIYHQILKDIDKEQSIFLESKQTIKVQKETKRLYLYEYPVDSADIFFTYTYNTYSRVIWARQEIYTYTESEKNAYLAAGWSIDGLILVKSWTPDFPAPISGDFYTSFETTNFYTLNRNYQYAAINYPNSETGNYLSALNDYTGMFYFLVTDSLDPNYNKYGYVNLINENYYNLSDVFYTYTSRACSFTSVLLKFFAAINPNIDSLQFVNIESFNSNLSNMFLITMSDFVLSETGEVKSNPSTNSKLTLKKILQFLKDFFNYYWYLEIYDHGPVNKWRVYLVHYSEIYERGNTSHLGNNTIMYKGFNFTEGNNIINYDYSKKYSKIKRNSISTDVDFLGSDIEFSFVQLDNVLSIDNNVFFTDLNDIYLRKGSYNSDSIEQFVVCACNSNNEVIFGTGAISGAQKLNVDLSIANLDNVFAANFSDNYVLLNNQSYSPPSNRLAKNNELNQFDLPIKNLLNDINCNEYFITSHSDYCILKSLSLKCDGTEMAKVNLLV